MYWLYKQFQSNDFDVKDKDCLGQAKTWQLLALLGEDAGLQKQLIDRLSVSK